jgi:hypothetical protein
MLAYEPGGLSLKQFKRLHGINFPFLPADVPAVSTPAASAPDAACSPNSNHDNTSKMILIHPKKGPPTLLFPDDLIEPKKVSTSFSQEGSNSFSKKGSYSSTGTA